MLHAGNSFKNQGQYADNDDDKHDYHRDKTGLAGFTGHKVFYSFYAIFTLIVATSDMISK